MTRLAQDRDTHLTPQEIAQEVLRQFDAGATNEPSIRRLAAALKVAPSAIYHHYPSRAAIVDAACQLVWAEVAAEMQALVPDPFTADPVDVLVAAGLATRRGWTRHHRVAQYMAATPRSNAFLAATVGLVASLMERLGLDGEDAAAAFHTYATFTLGSVMFVAARMAANEQLDEQPSQRFRTEHGPRAAKRSSEQTRAALDDVMDLSSVDPARDEALYVAGLRRVVETFAA